MNLARALITALKTSSPTTIPSYDKSAFSGAGDRVPSTHWRTINHTPHQKKTQVIILEGWCVGFRSLSPTALSTLYNSSLTNPASTLPHHKLSHLQFVNERLKEYDVITDSFDAFIHIDARELGWVYEWRLEQEEGLRRERGVGMSGEMVRRFVDGYFPAYEMFTEGVRGGVVRGVDGAQLRLVVGRDRRVLEVLVV